MCSYHRPDLRYSGLDGIADVENLSRESTSSQRCAEYRRDICPAHAIRFSLVKSSLGMQSPDGQQKIAWVRRLWRSFQRDPRRPVRRKTEESCLRASSEALSEARPLSLLFVRLTRLLKKRHCRRASGDDAERWIGLEMRRVCRRQQ